MMMSKEIIVSSRRIVVKVGSNVLTDAEGRISGQIVEDLVRQISELRRRGKELLLVTSGAIAAGMKRMGLSSRPKLLPQLQAAAAVGQSHLMHVYAEKFSKQGMEVAQILLTADDLRSRQRHLNARNTLIALLKKGIIPVINENDTVSTDEIKFGDNDALSALVAQLVKADLLVILTDTPGLMTEDPRKGGGKLIAEVACVTPDVEALARGSASARGTGGMASKIQAVKMVVSSGESAVIADGREKRILERLFGGERLGTFFYPRGGKLKGRKRWIAFFSKPRGKIVIDDGAASAIRQGGRSLLPSGVLEVSGGFKAGDMVSIVTTRSLEMARGLSNYSAEEMRRIKGLKTGAIRGVLGYKDYDEVVHCDNLVLMNQR